MICLRLCTKLSRVSGTRCLAPAPLRTGLAALTASGSSKPQRAVEVSEDAGSWLSAPVARRLAVGVYETGVIRRGALSACDELPGDRFAGGDLRACTTRLGHRARHDVEGPAVSGLRKRYSLKPLPAIPGTHCGPPAEAGTRSPSGDASDCNAVRCSRNITHCLFASRIDCTIHEFLLEGREERLGRRVVIAYAGSPERLAEPELIEQFCIVVGRIVASAVRMRDTICSERMVLRSHLYRIGYQRGTEMAGHRPPDRDPAKS